MGVKTRKVHLRISSRHSPEKGNPDVVLDSRFHGNDKGESDDKVALPPPVTHLRIGGEVVFYRRGKKLVAKYKAPKGKEVILAELAGSATDFAAIVVGSDGQEFCGKFVRDTPRTFTNILYNLSRSIKVYARAEYGFRSGLAHTVWATIIVQDKI